MYLSNFMNLAASVTGCTTCESITFDNHGQLTAQCGGDHFYHPDFHRLTPEQRQLYRTFRRENGLPLQLWQYMGHNLIGLRDAEDSRRRRISLAQRHHCRQPKGTGGLQLTSLFRLAEYWGSDAASLQGLSLNRKELTLYVGDKNPCQSYTLPLQGAAPDCDARAEAYRQDFLRDNHAWLQDWQSSDAANRMDRIEHDGHAR